MSNSQPGFHLRIQAYLDPLGADGWEYVREIEREPNSNKFWIFRRIPR